jgi:hypothetical protein
MMNISKDNPVYLNDNKHSPLSLSAVELGFSILVGVATWFGLSKFLHSTLPYPCGSSGNGVPIDCGWTQQQAWETLGNPLFSVYAVPLVLFIATSGIFMIRSVRKDVHHFSMIGNLAFSFPIFAFLSFVFLSVFSLYCLPIGLALSILAMINSGKAKKYKWAWVSLPFNLAWLIIFGSFISQFLNSYGD